MANNFHDYQAVIAHLRKNYLDELPRKLEHVKQRLVELEKNPSIYSEIYQLVHALKGSAGTYGLTQISAVCHELEDHLNRMPRGSLPVNFIDTAVAYVDLVHIVLDAAQLDEVDSSQLEQLLKSLRNNSIGRQLAGLLVESSTLLSEMCEEALDGLPVKVSVVSDGLMALERLLHTPFDFLITSREPKTLNGIALLAAVRASGGPNAAIPTVLMTSSEAQKSGTEFAKPEYTLVKDISLGDNLAKAIFEIVSQKNLSA